MTTHSSKTCLGCGKEFKRPTKSGYCSPCFHGNVHNVKSTYTKERWANSTAKLLHWRSKGIDLTPEDVAHFDAQTCCNFCGDPFEDFSGSKNLDHCHITGAYRGALCRGCNTSLGKLGDDLHLILERMFGYLRRSRDPHAT